MIEVRWPLSKVAADALGGATGGIGRIRRAWTDYLLYRRALADWTHYHKARAGETAYMWQSNAAYTKPAVGTE